MLKTFFLSSFLFFVGSLTALSATSEWYWISEPRNPMTGYFMEEIQPSTIGYTNTDTVAPDRNKTSLPEDFMETMSKTDDSQKCSGALDAAIERLRKFDSRANVNQPRPKCRDWCATEYTSAAQEARERLLQTIQEDTEECLETEKRNTEKLRERREKIREQKEQEEQERKRQHQIKRAVSECDADFFANEMTDRERMQTYSERLRCEDNENTKTPSVEEPAETADHSRLMTQIRELLELIVNLQKQLNEQQQSSY